MGNPEIEKKCGLIKTNSVLKERISKLLRIVNDRIECDDNIKVLILSSEKDRVETPIETPVYYSEENASEIEGIIDGIKSGEKSLSDLKKYEAIAEKECIECSGTGYQIYCLLLNETVNYYGIIQFLLKEISDEAEYRDLFSKESLTQMIIHRNLDNRTLLMNKYAQVFLHENELPSAELLIELSAQKYEGSESEARIYLDNGSIKGFNTVCVFDKVGEQQRKLESGRLRTIRKLMEMSKREAMYLLANSDMCITAMIATNRKCSWESNYICFNGYMQWSVYTEGKEEICYKQGKYYINSSDGQDIYEMAVEEFKNKEEVKKLENADSMVKMVEDLVGILKKQRHGTAVILTDDAQEASRLCRVDRGILLEKQGEQCFTSGDKKFDVEKILSVTEIDGALFMDLEGKCTAFGVIVDGIAMETGNSGKGARFNSIYNYVRQKKNDKIYISLIFSEDGGVEIVDNLDVLQGVSS